MIHIHNKIVIILFLVIISCEEGVYNPSENLSTVPVMDLIMETDDYALLLANRTNNLRVPVKIFYKDKRVLGEIRATGGGSRYDPRYSWRIILREDTYLEELSKFTLSTQVNDPTMLHTTIATEAYRRAGFPVIEHRHVFVRINNRDIGLYVMLEIIDEPFFLRRNLEVIELYKLGKGADFRADESAEIIFTFEKRVPDDNNYNSILELIQTLNTSDTEHIRSDLAAHLDIDNYLKYHAVTSLLNNTDAFTNNFHLTRPDFITGFTVIPWDFDTCFEREKDVGFFGRNAIIDKLLKNPGILTDYQNYLEDYLMSLYTPGILFPLIDSTATYIQEAYDLDPYLGNGRYNFEEEVSDLKSYIFNRRGFFINNLDSIKAPVD